MMLTEALAQAREALARGDLPACATLAGQAVKAAPDNAEAQFLVGMTLAGAGKIRLALEATASATSLAPQDAEYAAQHARLLSLARQEAAARVAADRAAALSDNADALTLDTIGCVYSRLSDHRQALPLFRRAVALEPKCISYRFNLATSLGFFGAVDEAAEHYEAILALDPGFGRAWLGLVGLKKQTRQANPIRRIEQALTGTTDPLEALRIHYAAAKACEDLGEYDRGFDHLATANSAHKQRQGFALAQDKATFAAMRDAFSDPACFAGTSDIAERPIFITGMPRTGTTLVDTILAAHPDVRSAGELQSMPLAIKHGAATASRHVLDVETIRAAAALSPQRIGQDYLSRARQHAGAQGDRFIDKFPLNFIYIGYIARALPHASIVCLRRHPMDTVWSNYKHLFATGSVYYGWSYDLLDTAGYYLLFDEMMAFWREMFPGRIHELSYEGLIADQEGGTRRLLDHCGLAWDEACLRFHETDEAVATPSAQQVRNPLHAGSVGKWRRYERQLEPARALFATRGILLD